MNNDLISSVEKRIKEILEVIRRKVKEILTEVETDSNAVDEKVTDILLIQASKDENILIVKELLQDGARVDSKGDDQMTALHFAAREGHDNVVKL